MYSAIALSVLLLGSVCALDVSNEVSLEDTSLELSPELIKDLTLFVEDQGLYGEGIVAKINEYVDRILLNVEKLLIRQGFDPMELPEQHRNFSKRIILIRYHGELDLTKGWLQDIATIHRTGDGYVSYSPSTKILRIEIPAGFNDLMFTYKYSVKFMNLGPKGGIDGKIKNVRVKSVIEIDMKTFRASLKDFSIVNSGHIDFEFTGHRLVDWLLDLLSETTTTLLHDVILTIVSTVLKTGLNVFVNDINDFVDNLINPTTPAPAPVTTPLPVNLTFV